VYKILHCIRIADEYNKRRPDEHFVPVYYMGSEDADLDELGHVYLYGEKLSWATKQSGAIGRMKPKGLEKVIDRLQGELATLPFGADLIQLISTCYLESADIQTATLRLVHQLFSKYGLIVLIPDNAAFKKKMIPVFEDELFNQRSAAIVSKTLDKIGDEFRVQAQPRAINLFYLEGGIRERIERSGESFVVVNSEISFTADDLRKELHSHPERFSPNVILRGLFQETILPDVVFVGGGGELAYWLELKDLFKNYKTFYPQLVLRNSFLVIDRKTKSLLSKLKVSYNEVFQPEQQLFSQLVKAGSGLQLTLQEEIEALRKQYRHIAGVATAVDKTLEAHVGALETQAIRRIEQLEKKLLKAEKKKYEALQRQLSTVKTFLFPTGGLQERIENFMPFYARWGEAFIDMIYEASLLLDQEFVIIEMDSLDAIHTS
jgi:bacillithiol biosynthesis cysteine-adding enzyme BshC